MYLLEVGRHIATVYLLDVGRHIATMYLLDVGRHIATVYVQMSPVTKVIKTADAVTK